MKKYVFIAIIIFLSCSLLQGQNSKSASTGYENGHVWVDLGLSVKWASCNVGASSPEGYGDFFCWGEISTRKVPGYYKWYDDRGNVKKYNDGERGNDPWHDYSDNLDQLQLSDDAARANWGGRWRMPTKREVEELLSYCHWRWVIQNGIKGYVVTSAMNGNSIFLPAAGYDHCSYHDMNIVRDRGRRGYYWTRDLWVGGNGPRFGWSLEFVEEAIRGEMKCGERDDGYSVRPVIE